MILHARSDVLIHNSNNRIIDILDDISGLQRWQRILTKHVQPNEMIVNVIVWDYAKTAKKRQYSHHIKWNKNISLIVLLFTFLLECGEISISECIDILIQELAHAHAMDRAGYLACDSHGISFYYLLDFLFFFVFFQKEDKSNCFGFWYLKLFTLFANP